MSARLLLAAIALNAILPVSALADWTVDITKITCHRAFFIGKTILSPHSIALWVSGYYSGRDNRAVVDVRTLERDARKIVGYCRAHRDETLAKAVHNALGTAH
jgi:acid stress chaperone HdeB